MLGWSPSGAALAVPGLNTVSNLSIETILSDRPRLELQVIATSARLQGCSVLRWSPSGAELAVPGLNTVSILSEDDLSSIATITPHDLTKAWRAPRPLDCAWLPGSSALAVWGPTRGQGLFRRFAIISPDAWAVQHLVSLADDVRAPQWGFRQLAATSSSGKLLLYRIAPGSSSLQLLSTLPAPLPVQTKQAQLEPYQHPLWPGLTSYAWSGRWLAAVFAPRSHSSDLAVTLLDGHKRGSIVWSYPLRETAGADMPGAHHMSWSADGSSLVVCITAGFVRKWVLNLGEAPHGCCEEGCYGERCPGYVHKEPTLW